MPPLLACKNPECCEHLNDAGSQVAVCGESGLVHLIIGYGADIDPEATRRAYRDASDVYAPFYTLVELQPNEPVPVVPMADLERAMRLLQLAERGIQTLAQQRLS
jgi:hypothetical protein